MNLQSYVPVTLSLLFAIFGWRIAREISLGDQRRKTWLLFGDYLNFINMLSVLIFCIIVPLKTDAFTTASRVTLAVSFVLIVFYPIVLAGHYRLFSAEGREKYLRAGKDFPWLSDQEFIFIVIALVCATIAGWYVAR
jgi:hypothetical protein